jgi:hypothetical protein
MYIEKQFTKADIDSPVASGAVKILPINDSLCSTQSGSRSSISRDGVRYST